MAEISEIMTPNPIIIRTNTTILEAIHIFLSNGITSSPVLDASGDVIGLMTELGLIRGYYRVSLKNENKEHIAHHLDLLEKIDSIELDKTVQDAVKTMLKADTHRVVVKDKRQKIVGIISPKDILTTLTGEKDKRRVLEDQLLEAKATLINTAGKLNDAEGLINRYTDYFESAPYMIHSVNEEGKIVLANKVLNKILGYNDGELIGQTVEVLFDDENAAKAKAGLKKLIAEGSHPAVMTAMRRKDGTTVRVETVSGALKAKDGSFIATISMSRRLASDNMLRALHGVLDMNANPHED